MKKTILEDIKINIKVKLASLWTSVTFLYIYGDYFELYVPTKVSGIINGNSMLDTPIKLFLASLLLAIPSLMICFSILLKPQLNKWLNIVFGLFFTAIMLLIAATSFSEWRVFYVFYAILESMLTAIIVWTAYNWTKQIN
ncbi:DUF6326 family protein [Flavobacterium aquatile]|uniref:Uncharacterized protein n=1 Tax=Flavobacterium aquatile LMG 4008 = ATCC 11947 TaxID=1453498 RepID=A0A095TWZ3_9FLAO|nr:DUF6326 family protein [Flavobacterium aquatile]KGD66898.1 hypothetical protein LG45_15840 [Flavobacterium aquatile LMG 4008 = ATCC 11947]OXA67992.1 hypothetical protein B0A61_05860 [Flavobacterium aquatile LMG 4008 = ATCC 11947]GEC80030.1 hypothetical protein FAQ01_29000 [Flavobacterium aquatile]